MKNITIFNLLILFQFIDFNIVSIPLKSLIIFLAFIYFIISSKIIFKSPVLFLILFFIYAIFSSVNLYNETESLNITRGYIRPILIFITVCVQIYLILYLFKLKALEIMPRLIIIFLIFEILLFLIGVLDNNYLKNEKGLHANLLVFVIYLFLREKLSFKFILIPFISIVSTISSSILALIPIVFYRKNIGLLLFAILIPLIILVFDELVVSKIQLLLSPPNVGTYGGRYWSNLIYIEQIKANPIFGSGLESLYLYKKESYFINIFDHGGSDILRLISEFGILGSILLYIFYLKIHNKIKSYGYSIDYIGLLIVAILSIKGIQIFSHPGMLLMVMFVIYKKNPDCIINQEFIKINKVSKF